VVDQISRHEDDRYGDRDQISLGTLWRRSPHIVYALSDTLIGTIIRDSFSQRDNDEWQTPTFFSKAVALIGFGGNIFFTILVLNLAEY